MNSVMETVHTKVLSKRNAAGLALFSIFSLKLKKKSNSPLIKFTVDTNLGDNIAVNKITEILIINTGS